MTSTIKKNIKIIRGSHTGTTDDASRIGLPNAINLLSKKCLSIWCKTHPIACVRQSSDGSPLIYFYKTNPKLGFLEQGVSVTVEYSYIEE